MPSRQALIVSVLAVLCLTISWWHSHQRLAAANKDDATLPSSDSRMWVLRLQPGQDLVESILKFSRENSIHAGGIVTCVGSLSRARLRYANQKEYETLDSKGRHFEIVSLVGTFSTADYHIHLAVANEKGEVFGGHASAGNKVYTTAEIILVEGLDWTFRRETDPATSYRELFPTLRKESRPTDARR